MAVSAICEWSVRDVPGSSGLNILYIVPRSVTHEGADQSEQEHGVAIVDHLRSPAVRVQLRLAEKAPAFGESMRRLLTEPTSGAGFLLPMEGGYAAHSQFMVDRLVGSALALSSQSFLTPGAQVVPFRPGSVGSVGSIGTTARSAHPDLAGFLESAVGALHFSLDTLLCDLEFDLAQRLSMPWILRERPKERRVCVVLDPVSPRVTRERWEAIAALGIKVVVLSSGSWWATSGSHDSYRDLDHLREDFISIDLTPDAQLWRRIVAVLGTYGHPIHGIFTPTDTYLVSVAQAAHALGLFTNGPEAYSTSTDKSLTRQLLDPQALGHFCARSLSELETRLASHEPVRFPVVCKPAFGRGSEGVFKAASAEELRHAFAKSLAACAQHSNGVLIEPYVDGPEVDVNLVLRDGRLLYAEVVDDFPSPAELESHVQSANSALFIETQAVSPSMLPPDEQTALIANMLAIVHLQGFHTGIFHCEARMSNSRMKYILAPGTRIPDLQPSEESDNNTKGQSVFLHEVNARVPGTMSSGASLVARGINFWALQVLCAVQDWERYEALAKPFLFPDQAMNHVVLTNAVLHVSLQLVQHIFPDLPVCQLNRQFVEGERDPMRELARQHPELMQYVVRHNTIVKSRQAYGGPPGEWLWGAFVVICSAQGRSHVLHVADRFTTAYEAIVSAADRGA